MSSLETCLEKLRVSASAPSGERRIPLCEPGCGSASFSSPNDDEGHYGHMNAMGGHCGDVHHPRLQTVKAATDPKISRLGGVFGDCDADEGFDVEPSDKSGPTRTCSRNWSRQPSRLATVTPGIEGQAERRT